MPFEKKVMKKSVMSYVPERSTAQEGTPDANGRSRGDANGCRTRPPRRFVDVLTPPKKVREGERTKGTST